MLGCRSWASHAFASKCRETNRMEMAALECFILVVFFVSVAYPPTLGLSSFSS